MASNLEGGMLDPDKPLPVDYWQRQMLGTVRFSDNLAALLQRRPQMLLEVGPGRSLSSLVGKVAGTPRTASGEDKTDASPPTVISCMRHPQDGNSGDEQTLYQALASAWTAGAEFDFSVLREGRSGRRVVLPTYVFEKRRCWPQRDAQQKAVSTASSTRADSGRLAPEERYYLPSWGRAQAPEVPAETGSCQWLVLCDENGNGHALAQAVVACLRQRGERVQEVLRDRGRGGSTLVIDPTDPDGFTGLVDAIEAAEPDCSLRVLYLWSLEDLANASTEAFMNLSTALSRATTTRPLHLWAISNGVLKVSEEKTAAIIRPARPLCGEMSIRIYNLILSIRIQLRERTGRRAYRCYWPPTS